MNSWPDSSFGYSIWTEFSGRGFKSHSVQLFKATSANPSVMNNTHTNTQTHIHTYIYIYIYMYVYIHIYTYIYIYIEREREREREREELGVFYLLQHCRNTYTRWSHWFHIQIIFSSWFYFIIVTSRNSLPNCEHDPIYQ